MYTTVLHWAGFGGSNGATVAAGSTKIYDDDVRDRTTALLISGFHWVTASMTGVHRRSGKAAHNEIMTPTMMPSHSLPFLSAATLHNLQRVQAPHWCTTSKPCNDGSSCVFPDRLFPGWCGHVPNGGGGGGGRILPEFETGGSSLSTEAIVGIVLGSVAGVILLAIGISRCRRNQRQSDGSDAWLIRTGSF